MPIYELPFGVCPFDFVEAKKFDGKSESIGNLNRGCVTNICPFAFIRKICNHNSWIVNTLAVIVNFPFIYYTLHQWVALQIVTWQNIENAMQPFQFSSIRRSTSLLLPSFIRLYRYVVMSRIVTFYLIYFFFFFFYSLIVVFMLSMIHPISIEQNCIEIASKVDFTYTYLMIANFSQPVARIKQTSNIENLADDQNQRTETMKIYYRIAGFKGKCLFTCDLVSMIQHLTM